MTWLVCKICGQEESFLYWFFRDQMCVSCYIKIDRRIHPIFITEEWRKHNEISEKAVEKYFREQSKKDEIK